MTLHLFQENGWLNIRRGVASIARVVRSVERGQLRILS